MVAELRKHSGLYARKWLRGGHAPASTGITRKHRTDPEPERYLKPNVLTRTCVEIEEDEFTRLEKAALKQDARTFEEVLSSITWKTRPSSDFLRAIHLALAIGAYTAVQRVSALGEEHYPNDEQIQKYARVLAPPRVTRRKVSSDPTIRANRDWLMAHGDEYRGKWVGLRNGELLDSDDSFDELITRIGNAKDVLITTVF
jgi:hypothetical protein